MEFAKNGLRLSLIVPYEAQKVPTFTKQHPICLSVYHTV